MKILINAYACSPNMGSEPGMGWYWIMAQAKECEVFVVTEGEYRVQIEKNGCPILQIQRLPRICISIGIR